MHFLLYYGGDIFIEQIGTAMPDKAENTSTDGSQILCSELLSNFPMVIESVSFDLDDKPFAVFMV